MLKTLETVYKLGFSRILKIFELIFESKTRGNINIRILPLVFDSKISQKFSKMRRNPRLVKSLLCFRAKRKLYVLFPSFFSTYTMKAKVLDEEFPFFVGNFEGSHWYGKHRDHLIGDLAEELEYIRVHISPGEILADVGAHHGYYALLFSRWVGQQGKVYAFECFPENSAILKKNLHLNGCTNVFSQECAIGKTLGHIAIAQDSSGILLSSKKKRTLTVPMTTLDAFFAEQNVQPTMLKIDVEGYEWEVLQGAARILQTKPKVVLEIHNFAHADPKPRLEKIFALFSAYTIIFWQPHPHSLVRRFSLSPETLEAALQQSNPRLYLIS